jgi:replicative DNA helicase
VTAFAEPEVEPGADENLPPQDLHAEQVAVGAVLLSPRALAEVTAVAPPSVFYRPAHEEILNAALALGNVGQPVDPITVAAELQRRGRLLRIGGAPYLHTLMASVPTSSNAAHWAKIVADKAALRGVIEAGQQMQQRAYAATDLDAGEILEQARAALDDLAATSRGGGITVRTADEVADAALTRYCAPDEDPPLPTGWADIGALLNGGLRPGALTVIAARPNVGKSILGVNVAVEAARRGHGALFVSLEMPEVELADRIVAQLGAVALDSLTARNLSDGEWDRVQRAHAELRSLPLRIVDHSRLTLTAITSLARDCQRSSGGLAVVVVDYLGLITPADSRVSRQEQVAAISRGLKLMAKELSVPVVALAQINRNPEARTDKRPAVSDLRESGAIEADADAVWLLHHDPDNPSELEVNVGKNRLGRKGVVSLAWSPYYARAASLERFREAP